MRCSQIIFGMVFAVVLWFGSGTVHAQTRRSSRGVIQGEVVDANGAPVSRAEIVWQTADGRSPHALRSDTHGHFRIAKVRPGLYELRASVRGTSSDWKQNVLVRRGRETHLLLQLSSTPPVRPVSLRRKDGEK